MSFPVRVFVVWLLCRSSQKVCDVFVWDMRLSGLHGDGSFGVGAGGGDWMYDLPTCVVGREGRI